MLARLMHRCKLFIIKCCIITTICETLLQAFYGSNKSVILGNDYII